MNDHAGAEPFAQHDAVEVADVEVLGRGFNAEGADHPHPLAERHRKGGIEATAADQQHGSVANGIDVRYRR